MMKIEHEFELVINVRYGGFSIDEEMALWLVENKNWVTFKDYKDSYPITHLYDAGSYIYSRYQDSIEFRSHPDLIECVRTLQKKQNVETASFSEKYYAHINTLQVVKFAAQVCISIENYNDGHERVKFNVNKISDYD